MTIDDRVEKFASTPNEQGRYPSDQECSEYESEQYREVGRKVLETCPTFTIPPPS